VRRRWQSAEKRLANLDQRRLAKTLAKPANGIVAAPAAFGAD
jgi:hypothetical protein